MSLPGRIPRDQNRVPITAGVSSADGLTPTPLEVNPITGRTLVDATITGGGSTLPASFVANQATVGTSAAALPSNALTEGVIVRALSTNTVSIYIGPVGVTTSTGHELLPGESTSVAVSNTNAIYAISGTAAQGLCFIGS